MKLSEIIDKNDKELAALVTDSRKKLADLHVEMRTKKVSNVKQVLAVRKTIAQALTIQRQREISALEATNE